jgi:dTDP-4-dehydrorhamnose 3,5-epimerase
MLVFWIRGGIFFSNSFWRYQGVEEHLSMTLNFVILVGEIRIVIYGDRRNSSTQSKFLNVILGQKNYQQIAIPPRVWVAFSGVGSNLNPPLNIADIEHDLREIARKEKLEWMQIKG